MLITAHRGASGYAPENTIAAYKAALLQGAKAIEIDVQLTKDEQVVVCHDWTINRTTNGRGDVSSLTFEEIRKFDAGSWYDEKFLGEKIPTLAEVLEIVPDSVLLNIEIKKSAHDERNIEQKVADILEKNNRVSSIIISSFNHDSLQKIKDINSQIRIAPLVSSYLYGTWNYLAVNHMDIYSFHPDYRSVNADLIRELHSHNIKIYCWTVNDYQLAINLEKMGVDGIITNYPDIINA